MDIVELPCSLKARIPRTNNVSAIKGQVKCRPMMMSAGCGNEDGDASLSARYVARASVTWNKTRTRIIDAYVCNVPV